MTNLHRKDILTFIAITFFYFFEASQMSYFNVLAPTFLSHGIYQQGQVAAIAAAYYYGDMMGLFPVGWALDHFPLRKTLLVAIVGSLIGTALLFLSNDFYVQWIARFISGFFGGTFSFLGGLRLIALLFPKRFTYFFGIFLAAGMFGGLICQYPLLLAVQHYGIDAAMKIMFVVGVLVVLFNLAFLNPKAQHAHQSSEKYAGSLWQMIKDIVFNLRNWSDVLMVVMMDMPVSVIGTLWGIVVLMSFFHFAADTSSWIIMALFAGLMTGLPIWGKIADRNGNPPWLIVLGAGASLLITFALFLTQAIDNAWLVAVLFFGLGFFSSVQSMGFTWLTLNMKPALIGRNSAFNSMVFMASNGILKQAGAYLLGIPAFALGIGSASNLLMIMLIGMGIAIVYALVRKHVFTVVC